MRRMRLSAALLFLVVFAVALVVQAPAELAQRVFGTSTPPVLALIAPRLTAKAWELPAFGITQSNTRFTVRYERFCIRCFGPIYRVGLAGQGFAGKGLLFMTPFSRRLALTNVRLAIFLPQLPEALRMATFQPLGRMFVTLERFVADVQPWRINMLAGRARWEGARSEAAPKIELGIVDVQLSTLKPHLIRAEIANQGGDLALSGALTLDADGSIGADLFLDPRPGNSEVWAHALDAFATREGVGWRLRRTIAAVNRL